MIRIWIRNILFFRKTFLVSFFWTILEPLMYLGGFGFGFGIYVPPIEQLPYLDFYFSGLMCTTIMMVSYFETTYPNFSKMNYQKTYSTILLTQIMPNQIWAGECLWGTTKGLMSVFGLVIVASFFSLYSAKIFLAIPVFILLGWIFSAFGLLMISLAKSYDSFVFSTSGLIVPLSLFSGTFFSLKDVPETVRLIAYCFPLAHAVEICRTLIYKTISPQLALHFAVLVFYAIGLSVLSRNLFNRRLQS